MRRYVLTVSDKDGSVITSFMGDSIYLLSKEVEGETYSYYKIYDKKMRKQVFSGSQEAFNTWIKAMMIRGQWGYSRFSMQALADKTKPIAPVWNDGKPFRYTGE